MRTTRWLPNTAFQTYFGKPAFALYGSGNKQPQQGGLCYGDYMHSHNINPHRWPNNPQNKEVFDDTILHFDQLTREGRIRPQEPPRKPKDEYA